MSLTTGTFQPLGEPPPAALAPARIELHWAAQVAAAAGAALLPAAADDSHTSLEWVAPARLLAGGRTPSGLRAALRPADLSVVALGAGDAGDAVVAELALAGRTLDEALAWMAAALGAPAGRALARPTYDMPEHPVARGARFGGADRAALAELARWYATGDDILRALAGSTAGASAVRCWPHHFDLGTLLPGAGATRAGERSVGVGLSPGDASYAEPYFYVTPWPYPEDHASAPLPALPAGGRWHHDGWFGAVLTGTALLAAAAPAERRTAATDFIGAALNGLGSSSSP